MGRRGEVIFQGSALAYPGSMPLKILGFVGDGVTPMPRQVDYAKKAKARKHRKTVKKRKRR